MNILLFLKLLDHGPAVGIKVANLGDSGFMHLRPRTWGMEILQPLGTAGMPYYKHIMTNVLGVCANMSYWNMFEYYPENDTNFTYSLPYWIHAEIKANPHGIRLQCLRTSREQTHGWNCPYQLTRVPEAKFSPGGWGHLISWIKNWSILVQNWVLPDFSWLFTCLRPCSRTVASLLTQHLTVRSTSWKLNKAGTETKHALSIKVRCRSGKTAWFFWSHHLMSHNNVNCCRISWLNWKTLEWFFKWDFRLNGWLITAELVVPIELQRKVGRGMSLRSHGHGGKQWPQLIRSLGQQSRWPEALHVLHASWLSG